MPPPQSSASYFLEGAEEYLRWCSQWRMAPQDVWFDERRIIEGKKG